MAAEHASLIPPLASPGRAEEIAARLTEAIHLGLLGDGEQLPPEVEFAEQLGVSPMTLRDAIATIRAHGLVETRRGRHGGTFIRRSVEPPEEPDWQRLRTLAVGGLRDLADEQLAIFGLAARLAAERAMPRSVRRILECVDRLAAATTRGARMKADSKFHIEVAIATRSERLLRREVALQAETAGLLWLPHLSADDIAAIAAEQHDIATAIAEEDGDSARLHAERHVRRNLRRLTAAHLELVDKEGDS